MNANRSDYGTFLDETGGDISVAAQRVVYGEPGERKRSMLVNYLIVALQWFWIDTRWTSLMVMDVSLWLILNQTENAGNARPAVSAAFSEEERTAIARN